MATDIFDEVADAPEAGDIFDQVAPDKKDIFDEIGEEPSPVQAPAFESPLSIGARGPVWQGAPVAPPSPIAPSFESPLSITPEGPVFPPASEPQERPLAEPWSARDIISAPIKAAGGMIATGLNLASPTTWLPQSERERQAVSFGDPRTPAEQAQAKMFQGDKPIYQPQGTAIDPEGSDLERLLSQWSTPEQLAMLPMGMTRAGAALLLTQMVPQVVDQIKETAAGSGSETEKRDRINNLFAMGILVAHGAGSGEPRPELKGETEVVTGQLDPNMRRAQVTTDRLALPPEPTEGLPAPAERLALTEGTPAAVTPESVKGGAESDRSPEAQAQSRANNSMRTFAENSGVEFVEGDTPQTIMAKIQAKAAKPAAPPAPVGVGSEKMVAAAFRTPDGRIFTGLDHMDADMAAEESGVKVDDSMAGFVNKDGKFFTRDEAYEKSKDQIDKASDTFFPGKLHTGKLKEPFKVPAPPAPAAEPPPKLNPVEQSASLEAAAIRDWLEKYPASEGNVPAKTPYSNTRDIAFAKAFNDKSISPNDIGQQQSTLIPDSEDARHAIETGLRMGYDPHDISAYLVRNYVGRYSAEAFHDLAETGRNTRPKPALATETPPAAAPVAAAEKGKGLAGNIRAKLEAGEKPGGEAGGGVPIGDLIHEFGRSLYEKGMKFADWSARMVKELGDKAKAWLQTVWDHLTLKDLGRVEQMNDADWLGWYKRMKFGATGAVERLGKRFGIEDLPDLLDAYRRGMAEVKPLSDKAMATFKAGNTVEGNRLMTKAQQAAKRAQTFHELARHISAVEEATKGMTDNKAIRAKMDAMASEQTAALVKTAAEATPAYSGVPVPKVITDTLKKTRDTIKTLAKTKGVRAVMAYTKDVAGNVATVYGQRVGNNVRGELKRAMGRGVKANPLDENALTFVREANGDRGQLAVMRGKIAASTLAKPQWKDASLRAIDHAEANWDRLNPIASQYENATHSQIVAENAAGINTIERPGYVMHAQDVQNDFGFFSDVAGEDGAGFKHARDHDTFADSIAAGVDPKSINAVTLLTHRVARGQMLINNRMWVEGLKTTVDPLTRKTVVTEPEVIPRGPGLPPDVRAPQDYVTEIAGGRPIAILKPYAGIFRALTEPSKFSESLGWNATLKVATTGKHIALMLDTFHLGRIAFWESIIKPLSLTDPKAPLPSYRKGVLTLDYSRAELQRMAASGEIDPAKLPAVLDAQRDVNGLVKHGYNVAKISDMLHQEWLQRIPITGQFNKWLFNQFQRGAMAEVGSLEVGRYRRMHPSWTDEQVYREVAKDLNTRFGNLGRQGIFKSKTAQDTARLLALAPQWNEGLIRSEIGAVTGTVKGVASSIKEGRPSFGILPRAVGAMLLGQFVANQIINYITRGKPTWENPEEGLGAKLSAWVPDVVGGGPGFFLHPAGLAAEVTHLLTQKYEKKGDLREALMSFLGGRYSTLFRPAMTFLTRHDVFGKLIRPENIWKETAKAALPSPIGASAAVPAIKQLVTGEKKETFPGQYQKQLMASGGVKTDQAPSPGQRIQALASNFRKSKGITESGEFYESAYVPLRDALRHGAVKEAKQAYDDLIQKDYKEGQIAAAIRPWTGGSVLKNGRVTPTNPKPFSGSSKHEAEFLDTLTPEQLKTAEAAYTERVRIFRVFQDILE